MKNKIIWKLTALFVTILLMFTVVFGFIFILLFKQHTININKEEMERKAISIANTIASFQSGEGMGMGRNGMGGYGAYLHFVDKLAMADVWIINNNLNLVTYGHSQSKVSYAELPENAEQIINSVLEGKIIYGEEFSGLLDTPSLTVGVPIYLDSNIIYGAVLLHSPISGIDEAIYQGLSALFTGVGIALILSVCVAIWLSYRFTNPLQHMKSAALRLAEGDYDAKTEVIQNDEIGQLAQTIDLLAIRLLQSEKEQRALDKLKDDFIANVSHELRTPIAVLRGSLEVLKDKTISNPQEIEDYYEQMLLESCHMERLVNDLLDLSRLQDTEFKLDMEEVNLCDVIKDSTRAIRQSVHKKGLTLSVECEQEECMIYGDYGRIRQMIIILLDNAIKFSDINTIIEVSLKKEQNSFLINVTDQGETIHPDELPYIFERFWKTKSVQNKTGTGLGLAITKQIANRHKASINVKSENKFTTFSIYFYKESGSPNKIT